MAEPRMTLGMEFPAFWLFLKRVGGLTAIGAVLVGGAVAGTVITKKTTGGGGGGGGTAPTTANIWVDSSTSPTNGSCTRSSTLVAYNAATACDSNDSANGAWDAAYQAASSNDRIIVKGDGQYSEQEIENRAGISGVKFYMANGENVRIHGILNIRTHDLTVTGGDVIGVDSTNRLQIDGSQTLEGDGSNEDPAMDFGHDYSIHSAPGVTGNVVENVHTRNVYYEEDTSGNTFRYGEVGPSNLGSTSGRDACADQVLTSNAQFVFEYSTVHGNLDDCGGVHIDAIDYDAAASPTSEIRGNHIYDCGEQCIFTGDPGTALIENNMIEEVSYVFAPGQETGLMGTTTFRYNTLDGDWGCCGVEPAEGDPRPGAGTIYGNVFLTAPVQCDDTAGIETADYTNNVWASGSTCDGSKTCTPKMSDGNTWTNTDRNGNLHISSSDTCARGFGTGNPATPAKDIDEETRPQGTTDAGADEVP